MACLYRHFDKDGKLLYVGISLHPVSRLSQHTKSNWFKEISRVEIEHFQTRKQAIIAERYAITLEKPMHNKSIPLRFLGEGKKPYTFNGEIIPYEWPDITGLSWDEMLEQRRKAYPEILADHQAGMGGAELAEKYGISRQRIYRILKKLTAYVVKSAGSLPTEAPTGLKRHSGGKKRTDGTGHAKSVSNRSPA